MTNLRKASLIIMFSAWVIFGGLWWVSESHTYEPVYKLHRIPTVELNAIAENMLEEMEADHDVRIASN